MHAVVGEDSVCAGHIDRRGAVGADRDRWGGFGGGDAGGVGEGCYVSVADLLREGYGRDVEGVRDCSGRGDHAGVLVFFEVAGGIRLVAGAEILGVVVELSESGEDSAFAEGGSVERGVVGGGVDKGLEDGTGGAVGGGMVELGGAVVAASNESKNLSGVRVERDERYLRVGDRCGLLTFGGLMQVANEVIDVLHADLDRFGRDLLKIGVERSIDA